MTDAGKQLVAQITARRREIPTMTYELWLIRSGYKRKPAFWEHAR